MLDNSFEKNWFWRGAKECQSDRSRKRFTTSISSQKSVSIQERTSLGGLIFAAPPSALRSRPRQGDDGGLSLGRPRGGSALSGAGNQIALARSASKRVSAPPPTEGDGAVRQSTALAGAARMVFQPIPRPEIPRPDFHEPFGGDLMHCRM